MRTNVVRLRNADIWLTIFFPSCPFNSTQLAHKVNTLQITRHMYTVYTEPACIIYEATEKKITLTLSKRDIVSEVTKSVLPCKPKEKTRKKSTTWTFYTHVHVEAKKINKNIKSFSFTFFSAIIFQYYFGIWYINIVGSWHENLL